MSEMKIYDSISEHYNIINVWTPDHPSGMDIRVPKTDRHLVFKTLRVKYKTLAISTKL